MRRSFGERLYDGLHRLLTTDHHTFGYNATYTYDPANGWKTSASSVLGGTFTGGYIDVPASASLGVGAVAGNSATFEAWIKPESDPLQGGHPIVEYGNSSEAGTQMWQKPYRSLFGNVVSKTSGNPTVTSPPVLQIGQWQHVALTFDKSTGTTKLYINGVFANQTPGIGPYAFKTATDFLIGARLYLTQKRFLGTMDEVRVWSRALSPDEVRAQYMRTDSLCGSLHNPASGPTSTRFTHSDQLGSIVATTDTSGSLMCREPYGAWGETSPTCSCEKERYNGRDFEKRSSIYNYGARYHHPATGRFISTDSYAGDPNVPQSHNRFAYVLNNPYGFTDPTGKDAEAIGCFQVSECDLFDQAIGRCRPAFYCPGGGGSSGGSSGVAVDRSDRGDDPFGPNRATDPFVAQPDDPFAPASLTPPRDPAAPKSPDGRPFPGDRPWQPPSDGNVIDDLQEWWNTHSFDDIEPWLNKHGITCWDCGKMICLPGPDQSLEPHKTNIPGWDSESNRVIEQLPTNR